MPIFKKIVIITSIVAAIALIAYALYLLVMYALLIGIIFVYDALTVWPK